MKNDLGERMKAYERVSDLRLPGRMPLIVRLDGKAFHAWTKRVGCERPFDRRLMLLMAETARYLCENMSGAVLAYTQSDEISVLLRDDQRLTSEAWFGKRVQKMVSIAASLATYYFNAHAAFDVASPAFFDARVFVLPEGEVRNYFVWRQEDAAANSLAMLAQSLYAHEALQFKSAAELHELCWQKGRNWNLLATMEKRGICVYRKEMEVVRPKGIARRKRFVIDCEIPRFTSAEAVAWWAQFGVEMDVFSH